MSRHSPRCAPVCRGGQPRSERFSPFPAPPERLAYGTSGPAHRQRSDLPAIPWPVGPTSQLAGYPQRTGGFRTFT